MQPQPTVAYDPEAYGWSRLSKAQKNLVRETVEGQVRKKQVIYYSSPKTPIPIPALTAENYTPWEFVTKALQIIQTFDAVRKNVRLVSSNTLTFLTQWMTLTFDADSKASFTEQWFTYAQSMRAKTDLTEGTLAMFCRVPIGAGWRPVTLMTGHGIGTGDMHFGTSHWAERSDECTFNVKTVFMVKGRFEARRPDIEIWLRARLSPLLMDLVKGLPPLHIGGPIKEADREQELEDLEMFLADTEAASLPTLGGEQGAPASNNELIAMFGGASVSSRKQKTGSRPGRQAPKQPRTQPARQAFVAPVKIPVPRLRTSEMLEKLGYRGQRDYKEVCPQRTHDSVSGSYRHAYSVDGGDGLAELRDKRNRAIVCGLLRQRVQVGIGDEDAGHKKPISLAYALATAASRKVMQDRSATADNQLIDRWLGLKGALIQADDIQRG